MAQTHCLISLDKGKELSAGSTSDLLLGCDPGRVKGKKGQFIERNNPVMLARFDE